MGEILLITDSCPWDSYDGHCGVVAFLTGGNLREAAPHLHPALLYSHFFPGLSSSSDQQRQSIN
jgi:hypothetical protein